MFLPGVDPINQACVGIGGSMLSQPVEIDRTSVVAATLLRQDVACLALQSQQSAHGRAPDAEQLRSRFVGFRQAVLVGANNPTAKVQ